MSMGSSTLIQQCIERLNAGDSKARDDLIRHSYARLERLTRRMLQDFARLQGRAEAEDVLQSALMRLLRALEAVAFSSVREYFRLAAIQIRRELYDLAKHHFGPEGSGAWRAEPTADAHGKVDNPLIEAQADSMEE